MHLRQLALVSTSLAVALPAQTAWTLLSPATQPPAYSAHAMAYHLPTDTTVLFGGQTGGVRSSSTWLWNGTTWSLASPATAPTARAGHAMTYDAVRGRIVLFGGETQSGQRLNDTWEWNGSNWILRSTSFPPPARISHCLAYHPGRGTTLLFGGYGTNSADRNDLWEWDGTTWTQIVTATSPSPRRATDMAFDPVTGNMILFSGYLQTNDTWMFNGVGWVQLTPTTSAPARYDHSMVTDLLRNRIVMFGSAFGPFGTPDVWEWNGSTWLDRTNATVPPPRNDTYLSYDSVREEVLMFGSSATPETWRYAPTTMATFTPQGLAGCPGTNGLPPQISSQDRPWIGESFDVSIAQVPTNGVGLVLSGLSDQTSMLGTLPLDLGPLGMPGCPLQVDPERIDAVFATGSTATWTLNIPNNPMLLGQTFYSQAAAIDLGANALGLTTGNYAAIHIGGK